MQCNIIVAFCLRLYAHKRFVSLCIIKTYIAIVFLAQRLLIYYLVVSLMYDRFCLRYHRIYLCNYVLALTERIVRVLKKLLTDCYKGDYQMRKSGCLIVCLCVFMSGAQAVIAEDKIDFEITADYFGKYIWRGQNLSDDPVFQPGVSASYKGLTAGIWGNMDTSGINSESGEFTEYDYYLDYSGDLPGIEGVGYSVGVINYYFPSAEDTTEIYWGLNFDCFLSPSVTVYYDIDEIKGTYVSLGIEHSFGTVGELISGVPIGMDFGASLGWGSESYNDGYWESGTTGNMGSSFNDLALSLSFPFELGGWSISPSGNYVTLLGSDERKSDNYNKSSDYLFAGIRLSKSF